MSELEKVASNRAKLNAEATHRVANELGLSDTEYKQFIHAEIDDKANSKIVQPGSNDTTPQLISSGAAFHIIDELAKKTHRSPEEVRGLLDTNGFVNPQDPTVFKPEPQKLFQGVDPERFRNEQHELIDRFERSLPPKPEITGSIKSEPVNKHDLLLADFVRPEWAGNHQGTQEIEPKGHLVKADMAMALSVNQR